MKDIGKLTDLATYIREHVPSQVRTSLFTSAEIAEAIFADPQAHVDALVEAGVLKAVPYAIGNDESGRPRDAWPLIEKAYRVVPLESPKCAAWIEVGYGREGCVEKLGHKGSHRSFRNVTDVTAAMIAWNAS